MKTFDIKASLRSDLGKKGSKGIRKSDAVPCVLYGDKGENIHFTVLNSDLRHLVYSPHSYLVNIDLDGKQHQAVMREIQFHPVSDAVLHIDFYRTSADKAVTIEVPIKLEGNSVGVKEGGKLQMLTRKLKVSAMPKDMPDTLTVDVTELKIGKSVYVSELQFPKVSILTSPTAIVCTVKVTRAAREAAQQAAAAAKK